MCELATVAEASDVVQMRGPDMLPAVLQMLQRHRESAADATERKDSALVAAATEAALLRDLQPTATAEPGAADELVSAIIDAWQVLCQACCCR
jgi:hypothetical protein